MKTRFVAALLCGISMAAAAPAFAQDGDGDSVGEVVVTGSFLKRSEGFPSASPVDVIGVEQLESKAPTNLANFFAELPYNFGSAFSTGRALGGGERGLGTINLRGLGAAATLTLLNGHRQTQVADSVDNIVDVNSLIPDIMVSRFEVLKDGASALYGTDAVAGVVNVITNDRFEGVTAAARVNQYSYTDQGDRSIQIMGGKKFADGRGHVVGAVAFVEQDHMNSTFDSPVLGGDKTNLRYTIASSMPGRYVVPQRGATGVINAGATGSKTIVDPTCGTIVGSAPTDVPPATRIAASLPVATATDCRYFFFEDNALQSGLERLQGFVRGRYDFTDNLRFEGTLGYTSFETETAYTAGETLARTIVVPGYNPGNPFRAVNNAGAPLFAVSSGVAAGYSRDGAAVFLPARDASNRVILSPTPTVAGSGIPFWEDVTVNQRLLGSQCGLPTNNSMKAGECALKNASLSDDSVMTASGYFTGRAMDRWDWEAGVGYSEYKIRTNGTPFNGLSNQLTAALQGLGGPSCAAGSARGSAGCSYFNPFGSSVFATGAAANTQETIDYIFPKLWDVYKSDLLTVDARFSGTLTELPAGDLGIAVGYQFRSAGLVSDYNQERNNGNTLNLNSANDFDVSRDTNAFFAETSVPLLENDLGYIELSAAVRHERIGDNLETTNPKIGLLYNSPENLLTMRATYGQSFVAPSLFRLFGNVGAGTAVNDCPVSAVNPVCTGVANQRITQLTSGNPNLKPQESEAYSYGFTGRPLAGWTFSFDAWHYTFTDLFSVENGSLLIASDPTGSITGRVIRNATGQLSLISVQYTNAAKLETQGFDFEADWKHDFEGFGRLGLNASGTYISVYDLTPTKGAAVIHGAGRTNDQPGATGLSPNPHLRTNFRATWSKGPHNLVVLARYYDKVKFSRATPPESVDLPSWTPIDLTYSFTWDSGASQRPDLVFTVGANNVFDKLPPLVPFPGFQPFYPTLYDIRGQAIWARVAATF